MKKDNLITGLNEDLAREWGAIARYIQQASQSDLQCHSEIYQAFIDEIEARLNHITYLTNAISALGGTPTTLPEIVASSGTIKQMLELDLDLELQELEAMSHHVELAINLGEVDLGKHLAEILAVESQQAHNLCSLIQEL